MKKINWQRTTDKLKGAVIGATIATAILTALPVLARVAQETITINFNNIRIAIDGQHIETENQPFIYNGRTYLPVRDVADAMGFDVTWEDATNTVHLTSRTNLNVVPNYPAHQPQVTTPQTPTPVQPPANVTHTRGNRPTNPAISLQQAIEIAYNDLSARGINATFRRDSGMDWERNQWVWELEFRPNAGRGEIEFYINVDTGEIVKFEFDR